MDVLGGLIALVGGCIFAYAVVLGNPGFFTGIGIFILGTSIWMLGRSINLNSNHNYDDTYDKDEPWMTEMQK